MLFHTVKKNYMYEFRLEKSVIVKISYPNKQRSFLNIYFENEFSAPDCD